MSLSLQQQPSLATCHLQSAAQAESQTEAHGCAHCLPAGQRQPHPRPPQEGQPLPILRAASPCPRPSHPWMSSSSPSRSLVPLKRIQQSCPPASFLCPPLFLRLIFSFSISVVCLLPQPRRWRASLMHPVRGLTIRPMGDV